ncbi:MAG: DUF1015 domain-containing protein [Clostridia bacterium]|nr:DUF1015 domain-containing protein [Lachnospiraceae bacterium]NCB99179.1 DUF1015 domain-containing protein [Clostridia bacterium]NCD02212.1 DUF1015 domain-containing protein [Clostridia bacterium]
MAIIKPFRSIRPNEEVASQVAALPYDVYNREEAYEEVQGHPLTFLRIDRGETNFADKEVDMYSLQVYEKARDILYKFLDEGIFIQDTKPCYYIYEQTMNGKSQTGLVGCASIDDYKNNVIKKHETTRASKEVDRINHVDICNAQTGPIFLAYRANAVIKDVLKKNQAVKPPVYDFVTEDDVRHSVWVIDDEQDIQTIQSAFEQIQKIYIADGHHRAASAVKVGLKRRQDKKGYTGQEEFNYFLSVLFPDEELTILPYNRLIRDLHGLSKEMFMEQVEEKFEVTDMGKEAYQPTEKTVFGMYLEGEWYRLKTRPEVLAKNIKNDVVEDLDVSILQNNLLGPILDIDDPKNNLRLEYAGGVRGLEELEKRCHEDMKLAFSMYPTSIQELFNVADVNRLMPPKSTWFEPKLRSGIFIHELDR